MTSRYPVFGLLIIIFAAVSSQFEQFSKVFLKKRFNTSPVFLKATNEGNQDFDDQIQCMYKAGLLILH